MTLDGLMSHGVGRDTLTGEVITSSEIDRLCCDAVIHRYVTGPNGQVLQSPIPRPLPRHDTKKAA
jgi:hypothetical protein